MTTARSIAIALLLMACGKGKDKEAEQEQAQAQAEQAQKVTITDPSGKGGSVTINTEGSTAKIETPEGTATFGANKLPDGFPLAVPPGATVVSTIAGASAGQGKGWHVQLQSKQAFTEVGAFYEKALTEKGFKVNKVAHTMGGEEMIMLTGEKTEASAAIHVVKSPDGTLITITWQDN